MKSPTLLCPVDSLAGALPFFQHALGLPLRLRDGERFAALDVEGMKLALVAGEERLVRKPALAFRVEDLESVISRLRLAGATLVQAPHAGPHELRAVMEAPGGTEIVLSSRLLPEPRARGLS